MQIAPLDPDRIDDAVALWRRSGLTRPWNDPADDARLALDGPASTVLAGLDDGALIATAMVGHDGHRGWVYYLAVDEAARGRGHGRAIMQACEAWLARRGVSKLNLMVRDDNSQVRGFYAALGYGGDDVAVLSRRLNGDQPAPAPGSMPASAPLSPADENEAPLAAAVQRFYAAPGATFTTPGHKRATWLHDPLLELDLPLATGADDAQLSNDHLGRAERLAAQLWSADFCRFSVGGSTHGNEALALAVGAPGERVAVSRNLHKSLFAGLILAGLEPVWMVPEVDSLSGLPVGVPIAEVERALAPGVRAVMLVEPSYVGVISDLEAIVERSHAAGVPVIVDQAWGSHLGLHPELPRGAMLAGADAMVISAHKTLTAFTQSSIVLARGDLVDPGRLNAAFELLNTTSPSAAVLASIDRSRALMARRGPELLERTLKLARWARAELQPVEGLTLLDESVVGRFAATGGFDPLKLVLLLAGTGASGFDVERDLAADGIRVEMADRDVLIPLLTIGDDEHSVRKLVAALVRSLDRRRGAPRAPSAASAWSVRPRAAMTPREAFFAPHERVSAADAGGRVCAETAAPYPPGIPVLAPGEIIDPELLARLRREAAAGSRVAYCSDPTLSTVLVVRR